MPTNIGYLQAILGLDTTALERGIAKADMSLKGLGRSMQSIGKTMSMAVTLPIVAAGAAAVKAASDFESSFANIRKTVNATEAEFSQIESQFRTLAKTIPTSVNELNRLGGVAGQLGIEAGNLVEFTKVIAMLGDTTDIVGEEAALSLARFMNVTGLADNQISNLGSTIVGLGNNFAAMESEIVYISQAMAPLKNMVGLTEQQILAFGTTIAASGGEAMAATTAFQKAFAEMQVSVLNQTDNLKVFADTAGVTMEEFSKVFRDDAAAAMRLFLGGLNNISKEGKSTVTVLESIGLADQRLIREFGKVAGNLGDLDRAFTMANVEWERNAALTEEANKRYATFESRMKIFKNRIIDLGISIGEMLMPLVLKLVSGVESLVNWFGSLSNVAKAASLGFLAIVAAAGPVMTIIGTIATIVGSLSLPIVAAIVALAALVAAFLYVWDNWQAFKERLGDWSWWENALIDVMMFFKNIFVKAIQGIINAWNALQMALGRPDKMISDPFEGWDEYFDQVTKRTTQYEHEFKSFGDTVRSVMDKANTALAGFFNTMTSGGGGAGGGGITAPIPGTPSGPSGKGSAAEGLTTPMGAIGTGAPEFLGKAREAIYGTTQAVTELGTAMQNQLNTAFVEFGETLGNLFSGDAGASNFFEGIMGIVSGFMRALGQAMIAAGVASQTFLATLISQPWLSIAAGVALVAAAAVVKNLMKAGPGGGGAQGLASGGFVKRGGLFKVGEKGEELVNLPKGSAVTPNNVIQGGQMVRVSGVLVGRGSDILAVIRDAEYREDNVNG